MVIQWFPGHMKKATREVKENLKKVDMVFEVVDSRCPKSSHNKYLEEVLQNKKRIIIFNKIDLANKKESEKIKKEFEKKGYTVVFCDSKNANNLNGLIKESKNLIKEKIEKLKEKGLNKRKVRAMVVGMPNVGKSTLINKIMGKKIATAKNIPGVTKKQQWLKLNKDIELLDTPGILVPKFENQQIAKKLSLIGLIKDDITPLDEVALYLLDFIKENNPQKIEELYKIEIKNLTNIEIMEEIAKKRFKKVSGDYDYDSVINLLIKDFRTQKFGKITLDKCDEKYEN